MKLAWEGPFFRPLSLDKVNREMCWILLSDGHDVGVAIQDTPPSALDERWQALAFRPAHRAPVDVHVRHLYPPRFGDRLGPLYLFQPWEFGAVPQEWVDPIHRWVERVVVPSNAVLEMYATGGVDPTRLAVVPLGVNPAVYHPDGPGLKLPDVRDHVILYVGGLIPRKGLDILLDAYAQAFSADDPVTLVVKSVGKGTAYAETEIDRKLDAFIADPRHPPVLELSDNLSELQMAALYRTADLYVAPYRGEGFALPVLEAMACGTAVMVSDTEPTREFSSPRNTIPIPGTRRTFPVPYSDKPGWEFEPDAEGLAALLKEWVLARPSEARRALGRRAAAHVAARYTWRHAVDRFLAVVHESPPWAPALPPDPATVSRLLEIPGRLDRLEEWERSGTPAAGAMEGPEADAASRRGFDVWAPSEAQLQAPLDRVVIRADEVSAALFQWVQEADRYLASGGLLCVENLLEGEADLRAWLKGRGYAVDSSAEPGRLTARKRGRPTDSRSAEFIWRGPVRNLSGYATGARGFLLGLKRRGLAVRIIDEAASAFPEPAPDPDLEPWIRVMERAKVGRPVILQNVPGHAFDRVPGHVNIGRTMFETDRVPDLWIPRLKAMDLVIVPSAFNVETFAAAGIPEDRLAVVPEPLDLDRFSPADRPPSRDRVRFLSVFDWSDRKGWSELFQAWALAFGPKDPVELVVKITRLITSLPDVERRIADTIQAVGRNPGDCALVTVTGRNMTDEDMAALYRSVDAFVLPTRGEGWGRPIVEAMASGLPVIVTHWSAPATYLNQDNALLLRYRLETVPDDYPLEIYRGHRWAVADRDHLVDCLRWIPAHLERARILGRRARRDIARFGIDATTDTLLRVIRPFWEK